MHSRKFLLFLLIWSAFHLISATPLNYRDCYVLWKGDSLIVENACIKRVYQLNNGNLITSSLQNKVSGFAWESLSTTPDLSFPGYNKPASLISLKSYVVPETMSQESYLETEIIFRIDVLSIKQMIRLYPETPVVANDFYFKGDPQNNGWYDKQFLDDQLTDVRFVATGKAASKLPVLESIHLGGKHWQYKTVSFFEMTDHFNSLVTVEEHQGVEVCSWFNPSYTDNYVDWKQDAESMIYLNQQYGIRTFKIDGLRIHNKTSKDRVDSLLSTGGMSYPLVIFPPVGHGPDSKVFRMDIFFNFQRKERSGVDAHEYMAENQRLELVWN